MRHLKRAKGVAWNIAKAEKAIQEEEKCRKEEEASRSLRTSDYCRERVAEKESAEAKGEQLKGSRRAIH